MNKKLIDELKGLGSSSILIIGEKGLKRVYTPFQVVCLEPILFHFPGDVLLVSKVKLTLELSLAYEIDGLYFRHYYFEVMDL